MSPQQHDGAGEPSGRDRLRRALRHPTRAQLVVAVLLAALGFAAVTQARANGSDDAYAGLRQSELIQALNGLSSASRRAESDISDLETTRESLRDNSERRSAALEQARTELSTLGILAGTLPATGPGVRITVEDPQDQLSITHLLDGIEELRDAGAEAIEINDTVRVVAQTSFEAAAGGIEVDGTTLTAPYTIDAIGNPDTLARALVIPGGFNDDVAIDDARASTERQRVVTVSVTRDVTQPDFAESTRR